jgi:trehalose/maltose hydrolase-like predicted phosphorylase
VEVLDEIGRNRIFNLAYYTWVEQRGIDFADFEVRRGQDFWHHVQTMAPTWDAMIDEFNGRAGVPAAG